MRKAVTFLALLLASGAGLFAGPSGASDGTWGRWYHKGGGDAVWVTNRDQGEVAAFDARTGKLLAPPIHVGTGAHDLVVSERAGKVYAAVEGVDAIAVLSAAWPRLPTFIPTGDMPHHISVAPNGRTVYVGLVGTNRIALIDTDTDTETAQFTSSALATARAHAPSPSRHGRFIFVPHETGNRLSALDGDTGDILAEIDPGPGPSEVLPTRGGRYLWVSLRNDGRVKRFDLWGFETPVEVVIGTATQPEALLLTPDERTLIVSLRAPLARLAFIDTRTLKVRKLVEIGGATLAEHGIEIPAASTFGDLAVMSPNGRYVYATFDSGQAGTGGVAVVDVHAMKKVDTWVYPTTGRLHGIDYSTIRVHAK